MRLINNSYRAAALGRRAVAAVALAAFVIGPFSVAVSRAPRAAEATPSASAPGLAATTTQTPLALPAQEVDEIRHGWNVGEDVLEAEVHDDGGNLIGVIEAVLVVPRTGVAYVVIDDSEYVDSEGHNILVPITRLKRSGEAFVLPGAAKDAMKALTPFAYPE